MTNQPPTQPPTQRQSWYPNINTLRLTSTSPFPPVPDPEPVFGPTPLQQHYDIICKQLRYTINARKETIKRREGLRVEVEGCEMKLREAEGAKREGGGEFGWIGEKGSRAYWDDEEKEKERREMGRRIVVKGKAMVSCREWEGLLGAQEMVFRGREMEVRGLLGERGIKVEFYVDEEKGRRRGGGEGWEGEWG